MTGTLVSSWAFAPWRHEAARTAAEWLGAHAPTPLDVVRADLDGVAPRAWPRPAIDAAIRNAVSLPAPARPGSPLDPDRSWSAIETYAEAAHAAVVAWRRSGIGWEMGYSGPSGFADHVLLAILREQAVVPRWVAHLDDLPTGESLAADDRVVPGSLRTATARILQGGGLPVPDSDRVDERVLALIASRADAIVVSGPELAKALLATPAWAPHRAVLAPRVHVWEREADAATVAGMTIAPVGQTAGGPARARDRVAIAGWVPGSRSQVVAPLLEAFALLGSGDRSALALTLASDEPAAVAPLLRDLGLEEDVALDTDLAERPDYALVVDRPAPGGLGWSPRELPELADWQALGVPVILVAPQDSPLTLTAAEHHLPAEHVSAARALLARLADG